MTVRITVSMPDDVHDSLLDQTAQDQRSMSSVVVNHVRNGMAEQKEASPPLPWADAVAVVREAIRRGMSNEQALEMGLESYPTLALDTVQWVRWDLRIVRGEDDVPTSRQARL